MLFVKDLLNQSVRLSSESRTFFCEVKVMRMELPRMRAVSLLSLLPLALLSGCGDGIDRPETVPVTGTVLYNGKPVEKAVVSFSCEGAPLSAVGVSDAEGKFTLSTFGYNDGAIVGTHVVTVSKADPKAGQTPAAASGGDQKLLNDPAAMAAEMEMALDPGAIPEFSGLLPEKYSGASSPLSETVSESGPNEFVLQLTD